MDSTPVVIESQLDWLTLAVHTAKATDRLERAASRWASNELAGGAEQTPFRLSGYYGWKTGRVRFGTRAAAGLIQLSGDLAERYFDTLYPDRDSISRLDLAVTVRLPERDRTLGGMAYEQACAYHTAHPHSAIPAAHHDAEGGWTTYLGDRSSDYYLRIYNKQAEALSREDRDQAAHYENCWRYELECKGAGAATVAKSVADASDRAALCQSLVYGWATNHGVSPAFPPSGSQVLTPGFRRRSDRETRLRWLSASVAPAIRTLLATGTRTEVLTALGLADVDNSSSSVQG